MELFLISPTVLYFKNSQGLYIIYIWKKRTPVKDIRCALTSFTVQRYNNFSYLQKIMRKNVALTKIFIMRNEYMLLFTLHLKYMVTKWHYKLVLYDNVIISLRILICKDYLLCKDFLPFGVYALYWFVKIIYFVYWGSLLYVEGYDFVILVICSVYGLYGCGVYLCRISVYGWCMQPGCCLLMFGWCVLG